MSSWIFQANPKTFKIDEFLKADPDTFTWLVTKYTSQIKQGDRVYIWRAVAGENDKAGVVAEAEVVSSVQRMVSDSFGAKFWTDPSESILEADRVLLKLIRRSSTREVLKRDWLKDDSILKEMLVLRQPAGTNFPLDELESQRLAQMWARVGQNWSRSESLAGLWAYAETLGREVSRLLGSPVYVVSQITGRAIPGVYNKVMNYRSLDPQDSRNGMSGAGEVDRLVWADYFDAEKKELRIEEIQKDFYREWEDSIKKHGIPYNFTVFNVEQNNSDTENIFTVENAKRVLAAIEISEGQKKMLVGHYAAPGRRLSVFKLGTLAGHSDGNFGRLLYGKLGRKIATGLGYEHEHDQIGTLAEWDSKHRDENGHGEWILRDCFAQALEQLGWVSADVDIDEESVIRNLETDEQFLALPATTRQAIISARIGQGVFREKLIEYWHGCAVTGCSLNDALIASHVVPWKLADNHARLDPFNGLLLTPNLDKMFDRHLISFDEQGKIIISTSVDLEVFRTLGINSQMRLRKFEVGHFPYLSIHRAKLRAMEEKLKSTCS